MSVENIQELIEFYIGSTILSEWTKQILISNLILKH